MDPSLTNDEFYRFTEKFTMGDDCWQWHAGKQGKGYGVFKAGGRQQMAHRVSYSEFVGEIPEGLQLDHLCRNTSCVRPSHLEPVTSKENLRRGTSPSALNGQKSECPNGHPYSGDNLYANPYTGRRHCRTCRRAHDRESYRRKYKSD